MPTLSIKVTREHIRLAAQNFPACPLAMALFDAGLNRPCCTGRGISLGGAPLKWPARLLKWYDDFQRTEKAEPIRFRLNVPSLAVRRRPYAGGSAVVVKVGRQHISRGSRKSCSSDPLALALRERGFVRPSVNFYGVYAYSKRARREVAFRHTPDSLAFVCETHLGVKLRPAKFALPVPWGLVANGRSLAI